MRLLYALLLLDAGGDLTRMLSHPVLHHVYHPHPSPLPGTLSLSLASPAGKAVYVHSPNSPVPASASALSPACSLKRGISASAASDEGIAGVSGGSPSPLVVMGHSLTQRSDVLWPTDIATLITGSLAGLQELCGVTGQDAADSEGIDSSSTATGIPAVAAVSHTSVVRSVCCPCGVVMSNVILVRMLWQRSGKWL